MTSNEDRISDLPRNVIECIMDFMPVRDAARTCVLSSQWRYVWADHPSLVLNEEFWNGITSKHHHHYDYEYVVNSILLHHGGYIRKFVINRSIAYYLPDYKIDTWLSFVRRRNLKELGIESSNIMDLYRVPCSVFSNSELTHLMLSCCIVNAKGNSKCFTNIQSLILGDVTLDSKMVLNTPLLTSLTLDRCSGVCGFNISAPRLTSLTLSENDYFNLKPFLTCKDIKDAALFSSDEIECFEDSESINFLDLLSAWPMLSELEADTFTFKHLVATCKMTDIVHLNLRLFTLIEMDLNAELIGWILCILENSPLLRTFEIWFSTTDQYLEEVNERSFLHTIKTKDLDLRTIKMKEFIASEVEVMFAKILLECTPGLAKMLVEENVKLDAKDRISILKALMVLQRAFPKAEIIYGPNIVPP